MIWKKGVDVITDLSPCANIINMNESVRKHDTCRKDISECKHHKGHQKVKYTDEQNLYLLSLYVC